MHHHAGRSVVLDFGDALVLVLVHCQKCTSPAAPDQEVPNDSG